MLPANAGSVRPFYKILAGFMALVGAFGFVFLLVMQPRIIAPLLSLLLFAGTFLLFGSITLLGCMPSVNAFSFKFIKAKFSHDYCSSIQRLIDLMLYMAVEDNVDKIVFGEPMQPFDVEKTAEYKQVVNENTYGEEIDAVVASIQKSGKNLPESVKDFISKIEFHDSPLTKVPVWRRSNGKWHQVPPLQLSLLNQLIEEFTHHPPEIGASLTKDHKPIYLASFTVGMEKNYCYSITIKEPKKIGKLEGDK